MKINKVKNGIYIIILTWYLYYFEHYEHHVHTAPLIQFKISTLHSPHALLFNNEKKCQFSQSIQIMFRLTLFTRFIPI